MTEFKNSKTVLQYTNDPLQNFLYALKHQTLNDSIQEDLNTF